MARSRGAEPAADTPAETTPEPAATAAQPTPTAAAMFRSAVEAEQEAKMAAAAPAAEKPKKKGTRNIELRLMGYIDRRLRALPVKARKRVVDWIKEYDIEDEG